MELKKKRVGHTKNVSAEKSAVHKREIEKAKSLEKNHLIEVKSQSNRIKKRLKELTDFIEKNRRYFTEGDNLYVNGKINGLYTLVEAAKKQNRPFSHEKFQQLINEIQETKQHYEKSKEHFNNSRKLKLMNKKIAMIDARNRKSAEKLNQSRIETMPSELDKKIEHRFNEIEKKYETKPSKAPWILRLFGIK